MAGRHDHDRGEDLRGPTRRGFLGTTVMGGGLIAGYGTFAAIAGRFLYPARATVRCWMFVAPVGAVPVGGAIEFKAPGGEAVTIARRRRSAPEAPLLSDFKALSSTCPHLGCQVHWQPQHERFFCPCHNGVFDAAGNAVSGPPAEAGQSLSQYPLRIENGLLFIEMPAQRLSSPTHERASPG